MAFTKSALAAFVLCLAAASASAGTADVQPPSLRFVFEERVDLEPAEAAGQNPRGAGNRIGITGGTISGPMLQGTVLPGGADWQLIRADGCSEIVADYFIRAEDKALIHVRNVGLACGPEAKRGPYAHATPVFTAPIGKHDWLNKSVFTSTIEPVMDAQGKLRQVVLRFYEVQ
ncbi:DUF3237 domain-containing protein [Novosphingobium subterraneum]|uniref:DUF3237 domain-containing protein n=1 Tax=Novosphingobium subterraneum TaxID=48936 RepID=UPI003D074F7D